MANHILKPTLMSGTTLGRHENARVEVHKDLNGGCNLVIRDARHPDGYAANLNPQGALAVAMALMEAIGIPVQAELARRAKERGIGP